MTQWPWDPETYLQDLLQEVPSYMELQQQVVAATAGVEAGTILELGIGTGETARRILERHPNAQLTAIDSSEEMLGRARQVVTGDLRLARLQDPLPDGPFDLVVSALAVHHLDAAGKQDLFRRIAEVLASDGTFVLGDLIVPADDADVVTEVDWEYDLPDRADDQLEWLRAAGLQAETIWSHKDLVVIRAIRPSAAPRQGRSVSEREARPLRAGELMRRVPPRSGVTKGWGLAPKGSGPSCDQDEVGREPEEEPEQHPPGHDQLRRKRAPDVDQLHHHVEDRARREREEED